MVRTMNSSKLAKEILGILVRKSTRKSNSGINLKKEKLL